MKKLLRTLSIFIEESWDSFEVKIIGTIIWFFGMSYILSHYADWNPHPIGRWLVGFGLTVVFSVIAFLSFGLIFILVHCIIELAGNWKRARLRMLSEQPKIVIDVYNPTDPFNQGPLF